MVNIAVLGYGTVGSGVVEVLNTNGDSIAVKAGQEIFVKYVLDLRDFPGDPIQDKIVHDYNIILNDPDVDIVVEVMGGVEPAYTFVKSALLAGKSVCTSNKELVAKHAPELMEIAKKRSKNFLYEASVGGGIPIIRPLNQYLTADKILEITGILNGTTNFILSKMKNEGSDFESVLKTAQDLGYAERNPSADVDGFDACRKIAILGSLAYGKNINYEKIYTEGITKVTDVDFMYAKELGRTIKLFGKCKKEGGRYFASVCPVLIAPEHPLYNVEGVLNGILVRGNVIGDVMFYGSGAGKLPTASAVVADVVDAVKHLNTNIISIWNPQELELADFSDSKSKFFVRCTDERADVEKIFENITYVVVAGIDETAFVTSEMTEKEFADAAAKIDLISRIRIED